MTVRVLIADDDGIVRSGLRAIIDNEPDLQVVGEAADGRAAVERAAGLSPDVVVMDVRMPTLDGLAATREIVAGGEGGPRILILTTFELDEYVYDALRFGASGFLLKRAPADDLIEAIRLVVSGESLVFPAGARRLIERFARAGADPDKHRTAVGRLTEREREVLTLVARGRSNEEIAGDLYVSHETVKSHVRSLLAKLDVRDRTQAVIVAYESGFVEPHAAP